MYDSSRIIAERQAHAASSLLQSSATAASLSGPVRAVHMYASFGLGLDVHAPNGNGASVTQVVGRRGRMQKPPSTASLASLDRRASERASAPLDRVTT